MAEHVNYLNSMLIGDEGKNTSNEIKKLNKKLSLAKTATEKEKIGAEIKRHKDEWARKFFLLAKK